MNKKIHSNLNLTLTYVAQFSQFTIRFHQQKKNSSLFLFLHNFLLANFKTKKFEMKILRRKLSCFVIKMKLKHIKKNCLIIFQILFVTNIVLNIIISCVFDRVFLFFLCDTNTINICLFNFILSLKVR